MAGEPIARHVTNVPARGAVGRSAVFGCAVAFVAALNLVRSLRPALLLDPEPSWAIPRLLLGLGVIVAAASVGAISAAGFFRWTRSSLSLSPLPRLTFSSGTLAALAAMAFLLGIFARLAKLDSIPEALWIDDVSEIGPALDLSGRWRDFADSVRPVPFGESPSGTVGVLYLEYFRLILLLFGTNTFSLRLPAAIAGVASVVTTGLLARRVLPRGGATLAIVVLAGLSWHVTMSRLGWVALVIAPVVSLATLLLLRSRDRPSPILALCAGALIGIGAHVYMAAWVAAAGLLAIALWPPRSPVSASGPVRFVPAALFVFGFCLAVSPLFLFRAGRTTPYFLRAGNQSLFVDVRYWRSAMPAFEAASDGISAPWVSESREWPQNVQLRVVFRALLAVAFLRALRRPRDELSMIVLAQAGAALVATVLGGNRGVPNGFRFGYLSDVTAIAIAGGALWTLLLVRRADRRVLATAMVGLLAAGSLLGARDFFLYFSVRPGRERSSETTLVARAASRWDRYGTVEIDPRLVHFKTMVAAIRRYRLDPEDSGLPADALRDARTAREFRIVRPGTVPRPGERAVEVVRGEGWTCAVVLGIRKPRDAGHGLE
jgi:hypothetical protein